jgi:hypothetical protein
MDPFDFFGDLFSLQENGFQAAGEMRGHGVGSGCAGNGDGLGLDRGEDRVDQLLAHPGCVPGRDLDQLATAGFADTGRTARRCGTGSPAPRGG